MARYKKRRKTRGCLPGLLVTLLFIAATAYIAYIAMTQPERFIIGANRQAVPALAEIVEPDEPEEEPEVMVNPFEIFSFYIPENQHTYENYQAANPLTDYEDIVWRVNARLYREAFYDATIHTDPNPLLVNPYHRLPDDFIPLALETVDKHGRQATPETIRAFRRMQEAGAAAGHNLQVQSAYRTIDRQRELHNQAGGDGAVARPGFSEHHTGRALDLAGPDGLLDINGPSPTGQWVADNAHEFGFIIRYTEENRNVTGYIYEPWHITYVGETIARAIAGGRYGSLEEYVAKNPGACLP